MRIQYPENEITRVYLAFLKTDDMFGIGAELTERIDRDGEVIADTYAVASILYRGDFTVNEALLRACVEIAHHVTEETKLIILKGNTQVFNGTRFITKLKTAILPTGRDILSIFKTRQALNAKLLAADAIERGASLITRL